MAAVEQRNGKKIGQPDAYRKYSRQIEQRQKAEIRHLAGHFGDSHRAPELVGAGMAPDQLADPQNGALDDVPGFRAGRAQRRPPGHSARCVTGPCGSGRTPITIWLVLLPSTSRVFISRGVTAEGQVLAGAADADGQRRAAADRDDLGQLLEIGDRACRRSR